MKSFKIKKINGGNHYKIFIRSKLVKPKAPLKLITNINPVGQHGLDRIVLEFKN